MPNLSVGEDGREVPHDGATVGEVGAGAVIMLGFAWWAFARPPALRRL